MSDHPQSNDPDPDPDPDPPYRAMSERQSENNRITIVNVALFHMP